MGWKTPRVEFDPSSYRSCCDVPIFSQSGLSCSGARSHRHVWLAALSPWRDDANSPAEIIVLQATLDQYQHDFSTARGRLVRLLSRSQRARAASPDMIQAWLTVATIDRVLGRGNGTRGMRELARRRSEDCLAALASPTFS